MGFRSYRVANISGPWEDLGRKYSTFVLSGGVELISRPELGASGDIAGPIPG
jgi:hypothetical protein